LAMDVRDRLGFGAGGARPFRGGGGAGKDLERDEEQRRKPGGP